MTDMNTAVPTNSRWEHLRTGGTYIVEQDQVQFMLNGVGEDADTRMVLIREEVVEPNPGGVPPYPSVWYLDDFLVQFDEIKSSTAGASTTDDTHVQKIKQPPEAHDVSMVKGSRGVTPIRRGTGEVKITIAGVVDKFGGFQTAEVSADVSVILLTLRALGVPVPQGRNWRLTCIENPHLYPQGITTFPYVLCFGPEGNKVIVGYSSHRVEGRPLDTKQGAEDAAS